ncbi:hypothetical protein CPB83DRAFT_797211 [Crepidotus variabilis]|uniref:t-SNARE coiled-coil homology domain-containing protein n=1 Tax=Crepidotus variabilis TaxID=179855 RepID=A0A9P6JLR1_9AGAR|nr:hypothetical protein CPB83DRAFT_797211 [Crepidotus variabilis]
MSLAKLTAVSTKTLSLLLERQRLSTLPSYSTNGSSDNPFSNGSSLHYPQIKRNLNQLREGILALQAKEGSDSEAAKLLRNQYDRMRGMLWEEERTEIPSLEKEPSPTPSPEPEPTKPVYTHSTNRDSLLSQPSFAPYTDDPEQGSVEPPEPGTMLQTQRFMMDEQDQRLDVLSQSINRQHHISLQINDELDTHHGLLQELDTDIDRTENRLRKARRKLDTVAKGIKNNASVVTIGVLIFILLILIIRYKT